jgi:adenylate cyclase
MSTSLLAATQRVGTDLVAAERLDDAVTALHQGLRRELGVDHAYVMVVDENDTRLFTLSSHGFDYSGVGSEVPLGEGPAGIAAQRGVCVRIPNIRGARSYAGAVARGEAGTLHEIPLPVLHTDGSLLAVPYFRQRKARGVIVAQSGAAAFFASEHEHALSLLGMLFVPKLEAEPETEEQAPSASGAPRGDRRFKIRHYAEDDSVFIDDTYIIKGVAGKLLARILAVHAETGKRTFTSKELRLEVGTRLAWARDNLDSRLLLLRQRLQEKACGIGLERSGRGVQELVVDGNVELEVIRGAST